MARQLLSVLGADPKATDVGKVLLDDAQLRALYETLTLTRVVDATCARLHAEGRIGFFVPSAPAAAVSAGVAIALHDGDWLFPSFRDAGAYLARGGRIDDFLAQMLSAPSDPLGGRQLPGHGSLPDGRFVAPSGVAGAQVQHAAGVAMAMQLRGAANIAVAIFGPSAVEQGAFHTGLNAAVRHGVPAVFVCRSLGSESPTVLQRGAGYGVETQLVDGGDCLAVANAVEAARALALDGGGATIIEAVVDQVDDTQDAAGRLRAFVEYRGLWDAEREEAFLRRCHDRVLDALEAIDADEATPPSAALFDDVWAERPWMLQEQASRLEEPDHE
jgi:TPP-dependent pyruvate/acetoin dehydrogenase alpha subunit